MRHSFLAHLSDVEAKNLATGAKSRTIAHAYGPHSSNGNDKEQHQQLQNDESRVELAESFDAPLHCPFSTQSLYKTITGNNFAWHISQKKIDCEKWIEQRMPPRVLSHHTHTHTDTICAYSQLKIFTCPLPSTWEKKIGIVCVFAVARSQPWQNACVTCTFCCFLCPCQCVRFMCVRFAYEFRSKAAKQRQNKWWHLRLAGWSHWITANHSLWPISSVCMWYVL